MTSPAYSVARVVAPKVALHLALHRASLQAEADRHPASLLPDAEVIEALVDAAFWASLRREEGYAPRISLAYLPPHADVDPLIFERPLALDSLGLARLAPAVERPGVHLGVGRAGAGAGARDLVVWGTTRTIPPFCFVVEVVSPGLLVLKHRPRFDSRKFVNVAVLESDQIKIIDERASLMPDCPALVSSLLGFDAPRSVSGAPNVLVQLAVSMRKHGRGGALLVVPAASESWRASIVHPIAYAVNPAYGRLADLLSQEAGAEHRHEWLEALGRAVESVAGLTAVDGATIVTDSYNLLAFGAKIRRRQNGTPVEQLLVTEPIEGGVAERMAPGQLGGTRHLSAAQFVTDQKDALALVASQDGHFTIFAWSPCENLVHAHRVETLLL